MAETTIGLERDGDNAFKFTFTTDNGKLIGRVAVAVSGGPDKRGSAEKEAAAKRKIKALAGEFAEAATGS